MGFVRWPGPRPAAWRGAAILRRGPRGAAGRQMEYKCISGLTCGGIDSSRAGRPRALTDLTDPSACRTHFGRGALRRDDSPSRSFRHDWLGSDVGGLRFRILCSDTRCSCCPLLSLPTALAARSAVLSGRKKLSRRGRRTKGWSRRDAGLGTGPTAGSLPPLASLPAARPLHCPLPHLQYMTGSRARLILIIVISACVANASAISSMVLGCLKYTFQWISTICQIITAGLRNNWHVGRLSSVVSQKEVASDQLRPGTAPACVR